MFEDFDELFEDFFNQRKNRISSFDELFNEMFIEDDSDLGLPDKVLEITENGTSFTKSIWNTPLGYIVKVELSEDKDMSLEEKLKAAIECENYEEAAKIRDEIKKIKNEKD
jgi:hypothetical protein